MKQQRKEAKQSRISNEPVGDDERMSEPPKLSGPGKGPDTMSELGRDSKFSF